jgi:hypothetical protein
MTNILFRIQTVSNGEILSKFAVSDPQTIVRGETAEFSLSFDFDDLVVSSSVTIPPGTERRVASVTIRDRGELNVEGTLTVVGDGQLDTVQDYGLHAGSYSVLETLSNRFKFRDRLPSSAPINSLLVKIEPATDLQNRDVDGCYGLITGVTDERPRSLTTSRATVQVDVLARLSEFSTLTDAKNALEV